MHRDQGKYLANYQEIVAILSLHISERTACDDRETLENRRNPRDRGHPEGNFTPNMG
jgi:hypothetical protein